MSSGIGRKGITESLQRREDLGVGFPQQERVVDHHVEFGGAGLDGGFGFAGVGKSVGCHSHRQRFVPRWKQGTCGVMLVLP